MVHYLSNTQYEYIIHYILIQVIKICFRVCTTLTVFILISIVRIILQIYVCNIRIISYQSLRIALHLTKSVRYVVYRCIVVPLIICLRSLFSFSYIRFMFHFLVYKTFIDFSRSTIKKIERIVHN